MSNKDQAEIILSGRLDGRQRNRLKRLLDMEYKPSGSVGMKLAIVSEKEITQKGKDKPNDPTKERATAHVDRRGVELVGADQPCTQ